MKPLTVTIYNVDYTVTDFEVSGDISEPMVEGVVAEDPEGAPVLNDQMLDDLAYALQEQYPETVNERAYDRLVMRAEAYYEGDR